MYVEKYYSVIWRLAITIYWTNADLTFSRKHVIVWFDPYVSRADIDQGGKYQVHDIVPMLQHMSTKFSKIMIGSVLLNQGSRDKSIEAIPNATALFNMKQINNDQKPLEVYMTFTSSEQSRNLELERIQQLADDANGIYNGTVHHFLFDFLTFSTVQNVSGQLKTAKKYLANGTYPYKLGVVIQDEVCLKTSEDFPNYLIPILAYVDVIFFDIRVAAGHTVTGPHQEFQRIQRVFARCKKAMRSLKPEVEIGFQTGWLRDEHRNGGDLDSQLAEYWRMNNEWAIKTNTTVCMFEAFDNPYKSFEWAKLGIWELDVKTRNAKSSEYVFVDKAKLIGIEEDYDTIYLNNHTRSTHTVKKESIFGNFSTNIIVWFEPYVATADINDAGSYDMLDIVPMVQKLATKFSKIMIKSIMLDDNVIDKSVEAIPYSTAVVNAQAQKDQPLEVYMTFGLSPNGSTFEFEEIVQLANIANAKSSGTVSNFVFESVTESNSDDALNQIKLAKKILQRNPDRQYKLGINVFEQNRCLPTGHFPVYLIDLLPYVDMVYFDIQVVTQRSPLVEFKRVRKIFLRCQKAVKKINPGVDVGFQTGWLDIYREPNAPEYDHDLELLVYWKLVSDWATRSNTTVIFYEAFDNPYKDIEWKYNGLWKLDESVGVSYANSSEYIFVEKSSFYGRKSYKFIFGPLSYPMLKTPIRNPASGVQKSDTNVTFSRQYVVVWFDPDVSEADINDSGSYQQSDIIPMINTIATKFSKIILDSIILSDDSIDTSTANIPYITAVTNKKNAKITKNLLEVIMTFSSSGNSEKNEFENVLAYAEKANGIFNGTVQTIICNTAVTTDNKKEIAKTLKTAKELINTSNHSYNLGVVVDNEYCDDASLGYPGNIAKVLVHADIVIVNIETWKDNTVRGPSSEFERVVQVFNKCKVSIRKVNSRLNPGLQTVWTKGDNSGNADYEMQLVEYWNLTGAWAQDSHTVVYLQYAFDIPYKNERWREAGIWRLDENYLYDNSSQFVFVDKIKEIEDRKNELKFRNSDFPRGSNKIGNNTNYIFLLGVICVIVIFSLSVGGLILNKYVTWKVNVNQLTSYELEEFFSGGEVTDGCKIEEIFGLAYNSELELAKELFFFDDESVLGSGAFGVVYQGWVEKPNELRRNIAVKTTKQSCPSTALKGLLSEIKVLSYLGPHDNIVNIIGAYTQELRQGKLYVFTELCALGSLQNYLRANHEQTSYTVLHCSSENLGETFDENCCPSTNFLKWATQIATGLEFIAAKQVVHADIATRNILLTADKTAKISDFGLSRRLYDYETYVKKQQEPLPWRWMAPEALRLHEFNEKTDVWSFGITLWEIYSFGSVPYPGLSWTSDFAQSLEQGLRVEQTSTCSDEMYTVILECCQTNPKLRPKFAELKEALDTL